MRESKGSSQLAHGQENTELLGQLTKDYSEAEALLQMVVWHLIGDSERGRAVTYRVSGRNLI